MSLTLAGLGWHLMPDLPASDDDHLAADPPLRPARVMEQAPGLWHVHDGEAVLLARARSRSLTPTPATGDWVLIAGDGADGVLVERVLPRRTVLSRAEAGGRSAEQVVAANIDVVAITAPADAANLRRLERELTAAWGSGAQPVVLLTKVDLLDDVELVEVLADVRDIAVGADVVAVSSYDGRGLDEVRALLGDGLALALVGPSGVGKSSLVNALAGEEVMATTELRDDGKGRHTTTSRRLIALPGGGLVMDTPGMREFAPWSDDGLDEAFADLAALAEGCRFSDCSHEHEPSCAVREAAEADEAVAARLAAWRALQRELAWLERRRDVRLQAAERKRWAALTREGRARTRPQTR